VLVSIFSWIDTRSAPASRNLSDRSSSSRVLRATRAELGEDERLDVAPPYVSEHPPGLGVLHDGLARNAREVVHLPHLPTVELRVLAGPASRGARGCRSPPWASVETRIQTPTCLWV
jgi:hypothetical protein